MRCARPVYSFPYFHLAAAALLGLTPRCRFNPREIELLKKLKSAIVVGALSGMGEALALKLVKNGFRVGLVARDEHGLEQLADRINRRQEGRAHAYVHDVTDLEEIPALFQKITHDIGGFDLIVYCAGAMPPVAVDEYDTAKDKLVFDVNVMGAIGWLNEAAIRCEMQHSGTIAALSSVAGDRGRKGQPVYCASKAALNTYLEGLRNRLGHRGVKVVTIKPGPVRTAMTEGLEMPFMISPEEAAEGIFSAIRRGKNVAYVPKIWCPIMAAIRGIPSILFRGKDI